MNPSDYAVEKPVLEEIDTEIENEMVECNLPGSKHKSMSPINQVLPCGILVKKGESLICVEELYRKCSWEEAKKYFDRLLS